MPTLLDLIGSYDNLSEEPGVLNYPSNVLAITICFMVRKAHDIYHVTLLLTWLSINSPLLQVFSWICVLFRLYTRFFIVRSAGIDDIFIILSLISTSVGSITICLDTVYGGMGKHFITLDTETRTQYMKVGLVYIMELHHMLVNARILTLISDLVRQLNVLSTHP